MIGMTLMGCRFFFRAFGPADAFDSRGNADSRGTILVVLAFLSFVAGAACSDGGEPILTVSGPK